MEWVDELAEVVSIEDIDRKDEFVYNIEVDELHNYYSSISGIRQRNCHLEGSDAPTQAASWLNSKYRFGLSGTPWRNDGSTLQMIGSTGPKTAQLTASDLIRLGEAVKLKINFEPIPPVKCTDYKSWQKVYREAVVLNEERNEILMDRAVQLAGSGRITLLMVEQVVHGQMFERMAHQYFDEKDVFFINGKMGAKQRRKLTSEFRAGEIPLGICTKVWREGVDFPCLSAMVMAGPHESSTANLQSVGRCMRKYPGKKDSLIVETMDSAPYLREWSFKRFDLYKQEPEFDVRQGRLRI